MQAMPESSKRNISHLVWWVLAVLILDQVSKLAVIHRIRPDESITVLNGFFNLVHIRNRGMAFGIMNRPDMAFSFYLLVGAGLTAVLFLLIWFFRLKTKDRLITWGISLILGGALGNMVDRFRFREVVDFLDFHIGAYHWPAFNIADSAITMGTVLIGISLVFNGPSHDKKKLIPL